MGHVSRANAISVRDAGTRPEPVMRINSVSSPLGLALAGPVADALCVGTWFLIAGLVTAVTGILQFLMPAVMRLEEGHPQIAGGGAKCG